MAAIPVLDGNYDILDARVRSIGGAAPKDFIEFIGSSEAYIAKGAAKHGPRECATEFLIAEIGRILPLKVARGRLVVIEDAPSPQPDVRFMSRYFLRDAEESLTHGIELAARYFGMHESDIRREVKREWEFYTVDIVDNLLEDVSAGAKGILSALRDGFARMMAFDALIGANDRHPKNWGIVENARKQTPPRFSPIFDTARGLFWNHSDAALAASDAAGTRQKTVESYADRSTPLIGIRSKTQPNHFDVFAHMVSDPKYGPAMRDVVAAFTPQKGELLLHRGFKNLFSRRRLEYIAELLRYRHGRLINILKTEGR